MRRFFQFQPGQEETDRRMQLCMDQGGWQPVPGIDDYRCHSEPHGQRDDREWRRKRKWRQQGVAVKETRKDVRICSSASSGADVISFLRQ
jgi:hypothetical protein